MKGLVCVLCLCAATAIAAEPDARALEDQLRELLELQREMAGRIEDLEHEIAKLKARQAEAAAPAVADPVLATESTPAATWVERVQPHADLRYRFEWIDHDREANRSRHRLRVRAGMTLELSERLRLHFQLASGSDDDPVSTNQTLGNAFSSKDIWIDLAYLEWLPEKAPGLRGLLGKMENPFHMPGGTELLWDTDLHPEGLALAYAAEGGRWRPFGAAGVFWADERAEGGDPWFLGVQAGVRRDFAWRNAHLLGGASGFLYENMRREPLLYDPGEPFGNSARVLSLGGGNYLLRYREDYGLAELFAEGGLDLAGVPVAVFGDYVNNVRADSGRDTGWLAGFRVGGGKTRGAWQLRYSYRDLERDAVVGAFTDSDFMGGGTGGRGHELNLAYQLTERARLTLTWFDNTIRRGGPSEDYDRLQLDLCVAF